MLATVSERRIANEWTDAQHLQACNTDVIRLGPTRNDGDDTLFTLTLRRTNALLRTPDGLTLHDEHTATLKLPRFFPAVPIEAYLDVPVFHPNVDPRSGFVCLWDRYSPGDTVIDTILRLQSMLSWSALNLRAEHVLQPDAAAWHSAGAAGFLLPLAAAELHLPDGLGGLEVFAHDRSIKRQRLS
jgi:ubiquitin-protein ligase